MSVAPAKTLVARFALISFVTVAMGSPLDARRGAAPRMRGSAQPAAVTPEAAASADRSLEYLRRVMDQYHNRFPVYDDVSSPGNHFHEWAKIPGESAPVTMNGTWTTDPHSGASAIRCAFARTGAPFDYGGFYLLNGTLTGHDVSPRANFGDVPNAGINLSGAVRLTFWARGAVGGEQVEFFVAGVGRNAEFGDPTSSFPDSSPRRPAYGIATPLTTSWQQFTIDLAGMDLSYLLGGFAWVAKSDRNPNGAVFYVDDIQYELGPDRLGQRLNEPRFLRSYTTLALQPDPFDNVADGDIDFVFRNLAFTYDNALAILAFLADGSPDSVRRARLIGDAFVYATQHDRTFNDNRACTAPVNVLSPDGARLRSAYAAGDIALPPGWTPNDRASTVPIPGFFVEATQTFYEVEQQAIDVGNTAWAINALRGLYQQTGQAPYLDTACKLANFIHGFRSESGAYPGFTGGVDTPETTPVLRTWASSEHNLDVHAVMSGLYGISGDVRWQQDAAHAAAFVESMWDAGRGCYLAGTTDPNTRDTAAGHLPVDVQAWSVLSLPNGGPHATVLDCTDANHLNTHDGYTGVDFNDDKDGVWLEGTAQVAVADARRGRGAAADALLVQLRLAQQTDPGGDTFGLVAAGHDGLSTGFLTAALQPFKYFRRLHVGATAWNLLAQLNANPYYSRTLTISTTGTGTVTRPAAAAACPPACASAWIDGASFALTAVAASGWVLGQWGGDCSGTGSVCTVTMTADRTVSAAFGIPAVITTQPVGQTVAVGSSATLQATASGTPSARYQWYRGPAGRTDRPIAGATSPNFTSPPLAMSTDYWVRASNGFGPDADSSTASILVAFADDALNPGSSMIRAAHIAELRARIDALRVTYGLAPYPWTDPTLAAGSTLVRGAHIAQLRNALSDAYTAAHLTPPTYTDPGLGVGTTIKAAHLGELRTAVRTLEELT
jgi:hypothetical protein